MNNEMSRLLQKKILLQALSATAETAQEMGDEMVATVLRTLMELKQEEFVRVRQLLWQQTAPQAAPSAQIDAGSTFGAQKQKIAC